MSKSQSPYETYGEWEQRTFCDNASRRGTGIGVTQCVDGKREFQCTVTYNKVESDTMVLCSKCQNQLKREARKHGYKFKATRITQ